MPNTTAYSFGDVVPVPFPFTDQTASKKRPAVVVSADAYHQRRPDVIVMAVTSQILRPAGALGEVLISDWQGAGPISTRRLPNADNSCIAVDPSIDRIIAITLCREGWRPLAADSAGRGGPPRPKVASRRVRRRQGIHRARDMEP